MYYFYFFLFLFAALMVAFIFKDNIILWPVDDSGNAITWTNDSITWQPYPDAKSYYVEAFGDAQIRETGGDYAKNLTLSSNVDNVETDGLGNVRVTARTLFRNVTIQISPP